jgi:hypothetical protein
LRVKPKVLSELSTPDFSAAGQASTATIVRLRENATGFPKKVGQTA